MEKAISITLFITSISVAGYALYRLDDLESLKITSLFGFSAFLLLLSFREMLSEIKFLGLEAKLTQKINEAEKIISDLKGLAKIIIRPTVITVASLGRWSAGFSHEEKQNLKNDAEQYMQQMGFKLAEIEDTLLPLHKMNTADLMRQAKKPFIDKLEGKVITESNNLNNRFPPGITISELELHSEMFKKWKDTFQIKDLIDKKLDGYNLCFSSYSDLLSEINNCSLLTKEEKNALLHPETTELKRLKDYCINHNFSSFPNKD